MQLQDHYSRALDIHVAWHQFCYMYTWKRCKVSSSRKREPSPEMDLCSVVCASLNGKVNGVLTMLSQEEVRCNNM